MICVPVHHGIPAVLHRDVLWLHLHSENGALVPVQPRKTRPYITENLLMGRNESYQITASTKFPFPNLHIGPRRQSVTCLNQMRLAQGHNAMTPVRLEAAATRYRVKHSTTEPLRSDDEVLVNRFFNLAQERCG